jgi:GNAT superfamily N-acetyltransferase
MNENKMDQKSIQYAIRIASVNDASEIARQITILGHPATTEEIIERWEPWSAESNICFVAQKEDGTLAGVITLHKMFLLHRPWPIGRITALVVDDMLRGMGLGRALVEVAEEYMANAGCGMLELTSHVSRVEAHAFYAHLGYERTSVRFAKVFVD